VAGIVVAADPMSIGRALGRIDLRLVPPILALLLLYYLLQGARWHFLLRDAGARLSIGSSTLLNLAGQVITALLPLGDLTRAMFASEAADVEFGAVAATVTVQELVFTLLLVLSACPALLALHAGLKIVVVTICGMALIVAVLTVPPLFCLVHGLVARIPLLSRLTPQIEELQQETVSLLHRPDTLGWSSIDAARVAVGITAFWLVAQALAPGRVGWWEAALVLAVSYVGGAISMVPAGAGANEASVVGMLVWLGVGGGAAAAVALMQRVLITGVAAVGGLIAYLVARRRLGLSGLRPRLTAAPAVPLEAGSS
jgi:uncharacterized membrane protein YbhN (UPF0104 family)